MLLRQIKRHYYSQSQTIQAVHKQVKKVVDISNNSPTFKMIDKPVWVEQWPLTTEKLQTLEQLV